MTNQVPEPNEVPQTEPKYTEASASWNLKYFTKDGFNSMITLRANSPAELIPQIQRTMKWVGENKFTPERPRATVPGPTAPAPTPGVSPAQAAATVAAAATPAGEETYEVLSVAHCVTESGKDYVRVKGGHFTQYGLKAWPEVVPGANSDWINWAIGTEYNPPAEMFTAVFIPGEKKKVIRFEAAPTAPAAPTEPGADVPF